MTPFRNVRRPVWPYFPEQSAASVVVVACRLPPRLGRRLATGIIDVDADPATVVHGLDPVDVATIGLDALGTEHAATAIAALELAHRIRQRVAIAKPLLLAALTAFGAAAFARLLLCPGRGHEDASRERGNQ